MSGDRETFERVFRAHHVAVHRYAVRRIERAGVEDAVGETFLVAWRRYDELDGDPLPWLLGIARRVCANHLRSRGRRSALEARLAFEPPPSNELDPSFGEDIPVLTALAKLRDEDREALLLVAWDGLQNPEAAAVLGCAVGTFAVRVHRARNRLAYTLERGSSPYRPTTPEQTGEVAHELP